MKNDKRSKRLEGFLYPIFAPLIRFFLRIRVTGRENIPAEGGAIVVANHISFADVLVISASFPKRRLPRYLAKAELFRIPILRGLIRALGAIPLERRGADVGAIRRAISVIEAGDILSLFPQGTRCRGKNPADTPIKSGVGMIASHTKVPIIPVCIRLKNCRYAFLRRIDVLIGAPLSPEELGLLEESPNYRAAAESAFHAVCELGGYTPTALPEGDKK